VCNHPREDFLVKGTLKFYAICVGFLLIAAGLCAGHYKIWRLQHPGAPAWTYFFR